MKIKFFLLLSTLIINLSICYSSEPPWRLKTTYQWNNPIPPRLQWNENHGYCGEVSLISAGLYFGQYISQYDARAIACDNGPQNKNQLLLGKNDLYAAAQVHLQTNAWDYTQNDPKKFLSWVKANVLQGYPVAIGVYTNEYLFYDNDDPDAGDADYDHIVPVIGISSSHTVTDPTYYGDDVLKFSDNGLWGDSSNPQYFFSFQFDPFQANREQANATNGAIYSLPNSFNYGLAICGVIDLEGDTLPVRIVTNPNLEKYEIVNGSTTRPTASNLELTITISGLEPNQLYTLYRYNEIDSVPHSHFNANASFAYEHWPVQITSGTSFVMNEQISSDEIAIYRAVKTTAP